MVNCGLQLRPVASDVGDAWHAARAGLVALLKARGIVDAAVLRAMAVVPRHEFLPDPRPGPDLAYGDHPLSIGLGQTISQPYIVAYITQCLGVRPGHRVLEIGAGCGYQAAILAHLGADVIGVERLPALVEHAERVRERLGYPARFVHGDGYHGGPSGAAPFDRILLSCAPPQVPETVCRQLADGGRLIAPVGIDRQVLVVIERQADRLTRCEDLAVRFVPMLTEPVTQEVPS